MPVREGAPRAVASLVDVVGGFFPSGVLSFEEPRMEKVSGVDVDVDVGGFDMVGDRRIGREFFRWSKEGWGGRLMMVWMDDGRWEVKSERMYNDIKNFPFHLDVI